MKRYLITLTLCIIFSASSQSVRAEELLVAGAASLKAVAEELAIQFQKETGHRLVFSFGASGVLYSQIANGAPYEVFLSADQVHPERLLAAGHGLKDSLRIYGLGRLVLWTRSQSSSNLKLLTIEDLTRPQIKRVAIANPGLAPYGVAAIQALRRLKLYSGVRSKLVYGDNVSQAAHFVEAGAADVGIIALSLALASPLQKGFYREIPVSAHEPVAHAALILQQARRKGHLGLAHRFMDWLSGPSATRILQNAGFEIPGGEP